MIDFLLIFKIQHLFSVSRLIHEGPKSEADHNFGCVSKTMNIDSPDKYSATNKHKITLNISSLDIKTYTLGSLVLHSGISSESTQRDDSNEIPE